MHGSTGSGVFRRSRRRASERGAAAVEFALLVPLLLMMLFGVIDYGWLFGENLNVRSAVRESARMAVVNETTGATPAARGASLVEVVRQRAQQIDQSRLAVAVVLVNENGNATTGDAGDLVVVCTAYEVKSLSSLGDVFYPLPESFTAKTAMRMEKDATFSSYSTSTPAWTGTCTA